MLPDIEDGEHQPNIENMELDIDPLETVAICHNENTQGIVDYKKILKKYKKNYKKKYKKIIKTDYKKIIKKL